MPLNVGLVNSVFASSLGPFNKVSPTTIKFLAAKVSRTDKVPPIIAGPSTCKSPPISVAPVTCKFPLKAASLA